MSDKVRDGVQGVNLPEGNTEEAKKLQSLLPKKPVVQTKKTMFEGSGTYYVTDKKIEVAFTKQKGHRVSTYDKAIIKELTEMGFKIITEEQQKREKEEKLKESRNKKTTNATMQNYVDLRIGMLKDELAGPTDSTDFTAKLSQLEAAFNESKKAMANHKEAINKRVDRLKAKVDGIK